MLSKYSRTEYFNRICRITNRPIQLPLISVQAYNELQTNTLEADAGHQISQYYGHWALDQPDVLSGKCVRSVLSGEDQSSAEQQWQLTTCEALMPFMCR